MAPYLPPVERPPGLFLRLIYFVMRRQLGKVQFEKLMTPIAKHSARMSAAFLSFYGKVSRLDKKLRLPVPTLLLAGGADVVTPPTLPMSSALSSNSTSLRVVPFAGRMLPEERPETLTAAARELFALVPSPGTNTAA